MKAKYAVQSLLFSAAALALSACSDQRQEPAPETAVSEEVKSADQAMARFSDGIDWASRPHARATLHGKLLGINAAVGEVGEDVVHHSAEYEWLAVLDYEPGAIFRHPVTYAFLTYEKPRITMLQRDHLPTLDYERIWPDTAAFLADSHLIHDESWLSDSKAQTEDAVAAHQPSNWPPRMAADQCKNEKRAFAVLIHNIEDLNTRPEAAENLRIMEEALTANGYHVHPFTSRVAGEKQPYLELSAPKGNGIYQLMNFINIHVDFNDCCEELIVYFTGETSLEKSGYTEQVAIDLPFHYSGYDQSRKPARKFYPEDLAQILDQLKTCHLNVIIDTNHAEGLAGDLLRIPNTESVLTSCQNHEYTYSSAVEALEAGAFPDPFGLEQGETGSEFTSSVAKALFEKAAERAEGDVPTPSAELLKAAFDAVKRYDLAYLAGKNTPNLVGRTLSSDCPCGIDTQLTRY